MLRLCLALIVLLIPALAQSQEADKPKPAFIGVQITRGADGKTIVVQMVINNSPAEKAGIKSGDVLKRINDIKPTTIQATVQVIRSLKVGKKVKFVVERDGKEKTLEVVPTAVNE